MSCRSLVQGIVVLIAVTIAESIAVGSPLFESHEPLAVILELPVKEVLREAENRPTVPGLLRYTDADGTEVTLEVALTTRGNSRLEQCSYPPLKFDLKRKQVASTIFAGQNKLKLVTQCSRSSASLRYFNQEYIIYRMYNLLTQYSFRVRRLEVTFRDSTGKRRDEVHPGFFIESDGEVAARLGMAPVSADRVNISQLDPGQLSVFTLFQFMIANTDWSVRRGPGTEDCCHNGEVIGPPGSDNNWVVLPYDFDQSGLIDARYALPSEKLPIDSVRDRYFRGFCAANDQLDSTIASFNDKRAEIEDLFHNSPGRPSSNERAIRYLGDFYDIINDAEQRQEEILSICQRTRT